MKDSVGRCAARLRIERHAALPCEKLFEMEVRR